MTEKKRHIAIAWNFARSRMTAIFQLIFVCDLINVNWLCFAYSAALLVSQSDKDQFKFIISLHAGLSIIELYRDKADCTMRIHIICICVATPTN